MCTYSKGANEQTLKTVLRVSQRCCLGGISDYKTHLLTTTVSDTNSISSNKNKVQKMKFKQEVVLIDWVLGSKNEQ